MYDLFYSLCDRQVVLSDMMSVQTNFSIDKHGLITWSTAR